MVRRLKWTGLFISLLFVVLFGLVVSPKATALQIISDVELDRIIVGKGDVRCVINGQTINGASQSGECAFTPAGAVGDLNVVQQIYNNQNLTLQKGDMLEFFVGVKSLRAGSSHNIVWTAQTYDYFSLVDMEKVSEDDYNKWCLSYNPSNVPSGSYSCSTNSSGYSNFYRFVLMANRDLTNVKGGLGYYTTSRSTLFVSDTIQPFIIYMSDIFIYKPSKSAGEIMEQDKAENEQQGQQSNTDSDQAGQDVEGATTNLLSAITGFFGAFTSASATTCQTDWGIEGFRNFDFCGTQVPPQLQAIFTIVASVIFIPMIWFLINSILSAFKEFQE